MSSHDKGNGEDNKILLQVVVSGQPEEIESNLNAPLHSLIEKALEASGTVGQPDPSKWVVTDESGNVLDPGKKLKDLGLVSGVTLFLNPEAGVTG